MNMSGLSPPKPERKRCLPVLLPRQALSFSGSFSPELLQASAGVPCVSLESVSTGFEIAKTKGRPKRAAS